MAISACAVADAFVRIGHAGVIHPQVVKGGGLKPANRTVKSVRFKASPSWWDGHGGILM
jgi:hypothetical protein